MSGKGTPDMDASFAQTCAGQTPYIVKNTFVEMAETSEPSEKMRSKSKFLSAPVKHTKEADPDSPNGEKPRMMPLFGPDSQQCYPKYLQHLDTV